jgi:DNA-directed RNA polymerase specialized sigma24 family protein
MAARDEAAFEAFVSARSGDLLRTAVLLTHDRGHAEDLLHAALVKAYRRWRRITADDPYPYVRRILVNDATSRRRAHPRRRRCRRRRGAGHRDRLNGQR